MIYCIAIIITQTLGYTEVYHSPALPFPASNVPSSHDFQNIFNPKMADNEDLYFLELAIKEAEKALQCDEVPVGCVVVRNGKIMCKAHNLTNLQSDPLSHAELLCLEHLQNNGLSLENLVFYITIEPCVMCNGILERINAKVYYGYENQIFGTRKLLNKNAGICLKDERCVEVLRRFYENSNPNFIDKT